jgi:hypothetical protein
VIVNNDLLVNGNTQIKSLTLLSDLNIGNNANITHNLTISGITMLNDSLIINGNNPTLSVEGTANINNKLFVNDAITLSSYLYISGNTIINGDLILSGNTNLDNTLFYPAVSINYTKKITENWILNNINADLRSVCWSPELELFCAVGLNNNILISSNGIIWEKIISNYNLNWYFVSWIPKLKVFYAIPLYNPIEKVNYFITSTDGKNWNKTNDVANIDWYALDWSTSLDKLCIVGANGNIMIYDNIKDNWLHTIIGDTDLLSISWSSELELFCIIAKDKIYISYDTLEWLVVHTIDNLSYVCWAKQLKKFCAVGMNGKVIISIDGKNWIIQSSNNNIDWKSICWAPELHSFCAIGNDINNNEKIMISNDGKDWILISQNKIFNKYLYSICWIAELGSFCIVATNDGILITDYKYKIPTNHNIFNSLSNNIDSDGNWSLKVNKIYNDQPLIIDAHIKFNKPVTFTNNFNIQNDLILTGNTIINGKLGIGIQPQFDLQIAKSAAKFDSYTWSTFDDRRLKENIQIANYDECYQTMSKLDLKYFKWRDDIENIKNIPERRKLGWIAQDVEIYFPDSIKTIDQLYGINNVKSLNIDQIYACMYGTTKKLMNEFEKIKTNNINTNVSFSSLINDNIIMKAEIAAHKIDIAKLQTDIATSKTENIIMKAEITALKIDNQNNKLEIQTMKDKITNLIAENSVINKQLNIILTQINK